MGAFVRDELAGGASGGAVSDALLNELLDERLTAHSYAVAVRTLSSVIREQGIEIIDLLRVNAQRGEMEVLGSPSSPCRTRS